MLTLALTCVFAFAAQEGPGAVAPAYVLGLDDHAPDGEPADEAPVDDKAKEQSDDAVSSDAPVQAPRANDATGITGEPSRVPLDDTAEETAADDETVVPPQTPAPQDGYTPLPEGKVLPPSDPPPKPVPPPIDDVERPAPQGLARPQFPALLTFPIQVITGVISGIGMVPVSALTFGLGICFAPAAITLAEVSVGDLVGQQRGTLFWPMVGAYCTSGACTGIYGASAGIFWGLVAAGVFATAAVNPILLTSVLVLVPAALFPAFVALNIASTAFAPAILYPFSAAPKNDDDPDLHFPGFFTPNHRAPRLPPGTPQAAMRF